MGRQAKMTERKLINMIRAGFGQGHRDHYRPWLKNTRAAISKQGIQSSGKVLYGFDRPFDLKSRQEKGIARALLWLGAFDVREQFPLWPWPHAHPLVGARGADRFVLPDAPGLLEIAKSAEIPHGVFLGTNLPYVATTDFMVTVHRNQAPHLIAIACKDRDVVLDIDRSSRPLERLELERLYSIHIAIPHLVVDNQVFGRMLLANLEWLMPDEHVAAELLEDSKTSQFHDLVQQSVFRNAIDDAIQEAGVRVGWTKARGHSAFRYLAWTQALDIDLTKPVLMTQPAAPGGQRIYTMLQRELFGEIDRV